MATNQYMTGRRKYTRPQAIMFSENPGVVNLGMRVPVGYEVGSDTDETDASLLNQFLILTDDNRQPIDFKIIRIEKRERMINGRMRSHHITDKRSFSVSWSMVPSRAFSSKANFDTTTGSRIGSVSGSPAAADTSYTTDGGAGGVEIKDWYDSHPGSFWVFLAYDNYKELGFNDPVTLANTLQRYNEVIEMYITDFSYSVQKRGGSNYDFWNISMTLEEV